MSAASSNGAPATSTIDTGRPAQSLSAALGDLPTDSILYVFASGVATDNFRPALRLVDGPSRERAEAIGRAWLVSGRPRPRPAGASGDTTADGGAEPLLIPLRSHGQRLLGVVVATPAAGAALDDAHRRTLHRVIEEHAHVIDPRATGPAPSEVASDPVVNDLSADLRAAVERDELRLAYQPEVDLLTGEVIAVEALVRWRHPSLGELGPEWFIALAERSDLIGLVGAWVLDRSVAALRRWNTQFPGVRIALRVNVSPVQLAEGDLPEAIAAVLQRHDVPGDQLCVELTEHAPLGDVADVARSIEALKRLGVTTAIDDLATGYSALSHLRSLPVDFVKIDRSLIHGIDRDQRARTIVVALIGLALNFDLGIIAEGVETAAEAATLLRLGCTRAQGHHLGRPTDEDGVAALLTERDTRRVSSDLGHRL